MKKSLIVVLLSGLFSVPVMADNVDFIACCDVVCQKMKCTPSCKEINNFANYKKLYESLDKNIAKRHDLVLCANNSGWELTNIKALMKDTDQKCGGNTPDYVKGAYCDWYTGAKSIASIIGARNKYNNRLLSVTSNYEFLTQDYFRAVINYAFENKDKEGWEPDLIEFINVRQSQLFLFVDDSPELFTWFVDKLKNARLDTPKNKKEYIDLGLILKTRRNRGNSVKECYGKEDLIKETLMTYAASLKDVDHSAFCSMYKFLYHSTIPGESNLYREYRGTYDKGKGITAIGCYQNVHNKTCI